MWWWGIFRDLIMDNQLQKQQLTMSIALLVLFGGQ
jgi:hypothetical protein